MTVWSRADRTGREPDVYKRQPAEVEAIRRTIQELLRQTCILQVKYDPVTLTARDNGRYQVCLKPVSYTHLLETMKRLVEQSGLIFVEALDADTHGSVTETSERIYVIAREHGKKLG